MSVALRLEAVVRVAVQEKLQLTKSNTLIFKLSREPVSEIFFCRLTITIEFDEMGSAFSLARIEISDTGPHFFKFL